MSTRKHALPAHAVRNGCWPPSDTDKEKSSATPSHIPEIDTGDESIYIGDRKGFTMNLENGPSRSGPPPKTILKRPAFSSALTSQ